MNENQQKTLNEITDKELLILHVILPVNLGFYVFLILVFLNWSNMTDVKLFFMIAHMILLSIANILGIIITTLCWKRRQQYGLVAQQNQGEENERESTEKLG